MSNLSYYRGLIIVYPYGTLIKKRSKKLIVKSKYVSSIINKKLLLIEDKLGLGFIKLSEPKKINLNQFSKLTRQHLITEADRYTWWPNHKELYSYPITRLQIFKKPLLLDYPTGPQITVKPENISLKKIFVGMSGYDYKNIYPAHTKDRLEYYGQHLNSVEINYTFYKNPTKKFVDHMKKYDLKYSIKVNQNITHYKQLHDVKQLWHDFYWSLEDIHGEIICFLFQFSPRFVYNLTNFQKIKDLAKFLNKNHQYSFEFRDSAWFNEKVYTFFNKHDLIIVLSHVNNDKGWAGNLENGWNPPLKDWPVSNNIYFRLHGTTGQYSGSYTSSYLANMFNVISEHNIKSAMIYFNNSYSTDAWLNANTLYKKFNYYNMLID